MNTQGISQKRFDRTSGLNREAIMSKMVNNTNTPIEMRETFTSVFPIFIKK
jgi:hypothetical protein